MLPLKSDDRLLLIQIILCFFEKKSNKNSLKKEINLGIFFFTKPDRIAKTKTVFLEKIMGQMDYYHEETDDNK
jgi:hypothetical protein